MSKIMKSYTKLLLGMMGFFWFYSNLNAASITGTIYQNDTTTPITTSVFKILVEAYSTQCPSDENCTGWCNYYPPPGGWVDSDTGTYSISGIDAGSYFLVARAHFGENYLDEWWATPESVRGCDEAQEIIINTNEEKSGVNFYLDPGGTISGITFKNDGITPLVTVHSTIAVYSETGEKLYSAGTYPNGHFEIVGIPTGKYYLEARPSTPMSYNEIAYTKEWWTNNDSSENFSDAQLIEITEGEDVSGKYFQVDPLYKILGTIFYDDGLTPVRRGEKEVKILISKTPCGEPIQNYSGYNDWGGDYLIWNIPPGNYYLKAMPYGTTRFQETFWNSSGSVLHCNSAQQIEVGGENNIFNKDFQVHFLKTFPWYQLLPAFAPSIIQKQNPKTQKP
jgi:hypothetical protein